MERLADRGADRAGQGTGYRVLTTAQHFIIGNSGKDTGQRTRGMSLSSHTHITAFFFLHHFASIQVRVGNSAPVSASAQRMPITETDAQNNPRYARARAQHAFFFGFFTSNALISTTGHARTELWLELPAKKRTKRKPRHTPASWLSLSPLLHFAVVVV